MNALGVGYLSLMICRLLVVPRPASCNYSSKTAPVVACFGPRYNCSIADRRIFLPNILDSHVHVSCQSTDMYCQVCKEQFCSVYFFESVDVFFSL